MSLYWAHNDPGCAISLASPASRSPPLDEPAVDEMASVEVPLSNKEENLHRLPGNRKRLSVFASTLQRKGPEPLRRDPSPSF